MIALHVIGKAALMALAGGAILTLICFLLLCLVAGVAGWLEASQDRE